MLQISIIKENTYRATNISVAYGKSMSSYGETEIIGAGFVVSTWSGQLDPKRSSNTIYSTSNDFHCVCIENERPSSLDVTCHGDDSQHELLFEVGDTERSHWDKVYYDISPKGDDGDVRDDAGARINKKASTIYSCTKIRIRCNLTWHDNNKVDPPRKGFNVKLG